MMNRLGVKEDSIESFMADTYDRCRNLGLTPENIASSLADLPEFSKSVPIRVFQTISTERNKKKRN
jgi:hypothetical protein